MRFGPLVLGAFALLTTVILSGYARPAEADADFRLTILHSNDSDSRLLNAGEGLEDFGGVARFKALVERLREEAGSPSIVVSSGDLSLAGPQFNASLEGGVPYLEAFTMALIGYDAAAIGNREFDFGPDVFANFVCSIIRPGPGGPIPACYGTTGKPAFPLLSANLDFSEEPRLQALVDNGAIARSTVVTRNGEQIGIIGATTPRLPFISSPRGVSVNFEIAAAVQPEVDRLTEDGVDKIILLSHLDGIENERELAAKLTGVDVIVAGGGAELLTNPNDPLTPGDALDPALPYPLYVTGADGAGVPVVTTAGGYKYAGRLVLEFDDAGRVVAVDEMSGPVRVSAATLPGGVTPDQTLRKLVDDRITAYLQELAADVVATTEVALDGRQASLRGGETNLGNLVADSVLWQAQQLAPRFDVVAPEVALINSGGLLREGVIQPGPVTRLDTFEIAPFPSFVSVVEGVTPAQFKLIMENSVSGVAQGAARFGQIAGFSVVYYPSGEPQTVDAEGNIVTPGARVASIQLDDGQFIVQDGQPVTGAPSVNFATIDFLARGGDLYPFPMPFTNLGVSYQQALAAYVAEGMGGLVGAAQYPADGEGRITP